MSPPATVTSNFELALSRLFDGDRAKLRDWMEQTQSRSESIIKSTAPEPLLLSPQLSGSSDSASLTQLCEQVEHRGFAYYEFTQHPTNAADSVSRLLEKLSLHNSDSGVIREAGALSLLQDLTGTPKGRFPPYQPKAMNWHTDGYYNDKAETIRSFTLHCIAPAALGGALQLLDDAVLVYALWQQDPKLVQLLCHPEAMTLPHNKDYEGHDRPDRSVPVIFCNADDSISMRFTTRTQNIRWRCDATKAAADTASSLIHANQQWHTRILLKQGQGIVTRNVLHAREKFEDTPDTPKRQMLRDVLPVCQN